LYRNELIEFPSTLIKS